MKADIYQLFIHDSIIKDSKDSKDMIIVYSHFI